MSPDLTMCSPTKFRKKCATCYRMTATPDKWQSYSNFSDECSVYYIQDYITVKEYNKKMNEIIKIGKPVSDTLIDMLEEASKYKVKENYGQKLSKVTKRVRK